VRAARLSRLHTRDRVAAVVTRSRDDVVACHVSFVQFLERSQERVLRLSIEHLVLVLEAIAIGTVIGVTLGVLVARRPAPGRSCSPRPGSS
jgi:ABC-type proline/glycine betaine transport system permease subunit